MNSMPLNACLKASNIISCVDFFPIFFFENSSEKPGVKYLSTRILSPFLTYNTILFHPSFT